MYTLHVYIYKYNIIFIYINYIYIITYIYIQAWTNWEVRCLLGGLECTKPLRRADFQGAHILPCKKEKNIRSRSFQSNR